MKPRCLLLACAMLGCQSAPEQFTPAVISSDSAAAVAEITNVISSALGREVRLSADVFSESSIVTLEHSTHRTIAGSPATGTLTQQPEQFRLVRANSGCAIIRLQTAEVLELRHTSCRAVD